MAAILKNKEKLTLITIWPIFVIHTSCDVFPCYNVILEGMMIFAPQNPHFEGMLHEYLITHLHWWRWIFDIKIESQNSKY